MSTQIDNLKIAEQLNLLAELSSLDGLNKFKVVAYQKASKVIKDLDIPIKTLGDVKGIPGVGKSIAIMIEEYFEYGSIIDLVLLKKKYPVDALTMTQVSGVGVKKAFAFYKQGIKNLDELIKACEDGKISNQNIVKGALLAKHYRGRTAITKAYIPILKILNEIRSQPEVVKAEFAGSVRRGKETIKDVDILVASNDKNKTIDKFLTYGEELIRGDEKARIILMLSTTHSIQVDILFSSEKEWGSKLAYFTGSVEHNVSMRKRAVEYGYKLNEHGLWNGSKRVAGETEESIYKALELPFCPPEQREGFELSEEPYNIVSYEEIDTDWHMHSTWSSDAKSTILEMAEAAKSRGLKEIGITDHVEALYKWDPSKVNLRRSELKNAYEKVGIKVFNGCESGVELDGSLDSRIPSTQGEYAIASIHKSLKKNTVNRLVKASSEPNVKIIGHPTTRIIGRRPIPDDDWDKLFRKCAKDNILLEINGGRYDLSVSLIRRAKEYGCKFVLTSDAHHIDQLAWIDISIRAARRAGLSSADLNKPL